MPERETTFTMMMKLVIADMRNDYERAAYWQRQLALAGWYVSKGISPDGPPEVEQETPKPRRSRKQATMAATTTS